MSETDEGNDVDDSVEAAFKVGGGNGSGFVFLTQQIIEQDISQDKFNGLMLATSTTQFRGNGVGQFRKPHDVLAQFLVIHVQRN